MGAQIEAQLVASKLRKIKGRGTTRPFTSVIVIVPPREDLAYLPPHNIELGVTLYDVSLVTDIRVPLPPKESPRHQIIKRPILFG